MALNAIQICNSALVKLGLSTITSLDEKTVVSEVMRERYAPCRDLLLRSHTWVFARKLLTLADDPSADRGPWTYAARIPTDHGRTYAVTDSRGELVRYERLGDYILSDEANPRLYYVKSYGSITDDAAVFPPDFAEVLACYLASDTALALTKDLNYRQQLFQQYSVLLGQARHSGATDIYPGTDVALWTDAHDGRVISNERGRNTSNMGATPVDVFDATWQHYT